MTNHICKRHLAWIGAVIAFLAVVAPARAGDRLEPVALRCEYLVDPLGIDEAHPRLTWRDESSARGRMQAAYRILVAGSETSLAKENGDLWDSGIVPGGDTVNVAFGGKPLQSRQQCFWKVRVWDEQGHATWSRPARWTMGLLQSNDWRADYIFYRDTTPVFKDTHSLFLLPAHQFRKEFDASRSIKRATIYATALGIYELHINGHRVGDARFAPGWTDYHQRAYYNTYDITDLVKRGRNAIGAWLADGWYSGYIGFGLLTGIGTERIGRYTYGKTPAFMAQLEIEYTDGSREVIATDPTWKVTGDGPIQQADFLMGEFYDARKETPGWTEAVFNDGNWESAIRAEDNGHVPATFYEFRNPTPPDKAPEIKGREIDLGFKRPPRLESFPGSPVRETEELKAVGITTPTNGVHIFDLGQNFAGVIRLKVKGSAGTKILLRYGEMLHPDGSLMTENLRKARATDFYVLRGNPDGETFVPRFTFHGFRYVEVTGFPGKPELGDVTGIVLHSDTPLTSDFQCSDPMVNRLFKNIVWTQRANFIDLPTDCPQRDERFGWTGDAQTYVHAATYNADVAAFYTKWLRELMESQRPSGTFPGYAPYPFQHGWDFGTAWCDAGVICPWTIWQAYGDTRIIERCWEPMTRFMEWRESTATNFLGINHGNDWGDWLSVGEKTPLAYIDTVYFAYTAKLMAAMAQAIAKDDEAAKYRNLFASIKGAFNEKYVHADGSLTVNSQTAYALALFMDLLPENLRMPAGAILAKRIQAKANDRNSGMTTGFIGTRPLLPVLSSVGQFDTAIQLFQSRKYPSWGYEVEQGATTIWERWNGFTKDKGFGGRQNAEMNSFAHYSFGAVCEWMFSQLAGISSDGPGYRKIIIRPTPPSPTLNLAVKPIDWVKAHYDSVCGRIECNWKLSDGRFTLETTIPANTTATVYVPAKSADAITESKKPLSKVKGVTFLRTEGDRSVLAVESGTYRFESEL
jgi:alpha-L-rhamnosidase